MILSSYYVINTSPIRTHLQYLVFCGATEEKMLLLRVIFNIFEAVPGLHINWSRRFIYPVNRVSNIEDLAEKLGG